MEPLHPTQDLSVSVLVRACTYTGAWSVDGSRLRFLICINLQGGDLSINFRGCFSQQLKALLAYLSRMNCLSLGKFSTVGAQGRLSGAVGGSSLLGQAHVSPEVGTPELEHWVGLMSHNKEGVAFSHEPTSGNPGLTIPRSTQAWNDR